MTGDKNKQSDVTDRWFELFNDTFGVEHKKTSIWYLLDELQEKKHGEQEETSAKSKLADRLLAKYRNSQSEFLVSQEDVEEVIECCCCVLETIYGISISMPYSAKINYLGKDDSPIEIKNVSGFDTAVKTREKRRIWAKKQTKESKMTIEVLCNVPYISVIIAFLEKCFGAEIGKLRIFGNLEAEKDLKDNSDVRENGDGMEEKKERSKEQEGPEREEAERSKERERTKREEAERNKEQEELERQKEEWRNSQPHIIAWLVANCLYIMGELAYAKQYIEDYQKGGKNKEFNEVCILLGIPWNVPGKELDKVIEMVRDKGDNQKSNEEESGERK